jgi:acyl-CoA thioesterase FadM
LNQQRWDGAEIPDSFGIKLEAQIDPALAKIDADNKKAVPMPEHIRKKIEQLKRI